MKKYNQILRLLSIDDKMAINENGMILSLAKDVFQKAMFVKANQLKLISIQEYELIKPAKYADMFTSLTDNLDEICFSQVQIIEFCKKHSEKFRPNNYAYLFLTKINEEYCVANVRLYSVLSETLNVYVYPLFDEDENNKEGSNFIWECNEFPPHIFVPIK